MPDIFLYAGEANPNDIKLRDPLIPNVTIPSGVMFWTGILHSDKRPYRTYGSAQKNQFKVYPQS